MKKLLNNKKNRQSKWVSLFLIALLTILSPAIAFAAQVEATVSKNIVGLNDVFQLTVKIDDSVNAHALDLSPLDADFNYGTPSVSNSTSMINGVISRSTEWNVALAAKKMGKIVIPSFRIGATESQPITITVEKNGNASATKTTQDQQAVQLLTEVDKSSLYQGETFSYRVELRIGAQMSQASLTAPYGDGLDVVQQGDDRQTETVVNGRRYIVVTRYYQITAEKPGKITLNGAKFSGNIVKGNRGGFGFSPSVNIPVKRTAENIALEIKAKPESYTGLWIPTTDLKLEQQWQPQNSTVKVGEPLTRLITLKIKNTSQSNMPNISLEYPSSVRSYNEKPEYSNQNGYTVMTVKQVIIPRKEGKLSLPGLSVNWFNTVTGKEQTSSIDGMKLTVMPEEANTNSTLNNQEDKIADITDTNVASSTSSSVTKNDSAYASIWPWLTALMTILWLGTTIALLKAKRSKQTRSAVINSEAVTVSTLEGLQQAAERNEPIKAQTYFRQWKNENLQLVGSSEAQKVAHEIEIMMNAAYSKQATTWKNGALLQAIKALPTASTKKSQSRSHLAELDPNK
ncbi:protein BatD [Photobacterium damselae subsp. damselae]|uniref:BatD family protein n=1 Tax=Photobacterium damselae TaxID=38293 RepID=UPI0015949D06|nr:BatD family protein [Photobacterium damselae]MBA5685272.1 protein BatD [Photobacterium damselae subsp. damselae]NVH51793.1 protein BatD [Photobacterium damselae subsp. damselae]NVO79683.1 protein BatD [Photobacterium damselae subsp. damselae]